MYLQSLEIIDLRVLEQNHPDWDPENEGLALNSFRTGWVRLGPAGSGKVRLGPAGSGWVRLVLLGRLGPAKSGWVGSPGPAE